MVTPSHATFRDQVLRDARELVQRDRERFTAAGLQLDEVFSAFKVPDKYGNSVPGADVLEPQQLMLRKVCEAVNMFRFPQDHEYDNHLDFESNDTIDEPLLAARMGILVMLAAADPHKDMAVDPSMGEIASAPFSLRSDDDEIIVGGTEWVTWSEPDWDNHNEPSPRVLERLKDAITFVRDALEDQPEQNLGIRIPSGDGRPCNEPGVSIYDEAERSIRDICRYADHFASAVDRHAQLSSSYAVPGDREEIEQLV